MTTPLAKSPWLPSRSFPVASPRSPTRPRTLLTAPWMRECSAKTRRVWRAHPAATGSPGLGGPSPSSGALGGSFPHLFLRPVHHRGGLPEHRTPDLTRSVRLRLATTTTTAAAGGRHPGPPPGVHGRRPRSANNHIKHHTPGASTFQAPKGHHRSNREFSNGDSIRHPIWQSQERKQTTIHHRYQAKQSKDEQLQAVCVHRMMKLGRCVS